MSTAVWDTDRDWDELTPGERQARLEEARRQQEARYQQERLVFLKRVPPTEKQIELLQRLGETTRPANRLMAGQRIDALLRSRGREVWR